MGTRLLVLPLLALLLGGCLSLKKGKPHEVAMDVPSRFTHGLASEEPRFEPFEDRLLERRLKEALANNQDLQASAQRVRQSIARVQVVGAAMLPQLEGGAGASRDKRNFIGFSALSGGGSEVASSRSDTFSLNLSVRWELDLWGRLEREREAAREQSLASEAAYDDAALALSARLADTHFRLGEARLQLELAEKTAANLDEHVRFVESRFERGLASSLDLRLMKSNRDRARAITSQRALQREQLASALQLLLGAYPDGAIEGPASLPTLGDPPPAGLPSSLLERRPDLRASAAEVEASRLQAEAAERARLPRISLTASGGTSSEELDQVLKEDFSVWSLAGNLVQPIFQGGRLKAEAEASEARWREAQAQYRQQALLAFSEVEQALANEQFLRERGRALESAAREAAQAHDLAWERYRKGVETVAVVLDAQRRAFEAQSDLYGLQRERLTNRINLYLALGGGFQP